jgi:hypothetical protein
MKFPARVTFAFLLFLPGLSYGQSPFDGTWRTNDDKSKLSEQPVVLSVTNGVYDCASCSPPIHVKADGKDQRVAGQSFDTLSVREINSNSIELTYKKSGKIVTEEVESADKDILTGNGTAYPPDSQQSVTFKTTATRLEKGVSGSNIVSGSWRMSRIQSSENNLLSTYKLEGNQFTMTSPTGEGYTAKLDGKDYPSKGADEYDTVSLKKIDDRTIEETDKFHGTPVEVYKMTVSPDGRTMTTVATNPRTGRTSTFIAEKQ